MQQLTKFELARVIGLRALQLENGAPHLLDIEPQFREDCIYIATKELEMGKLRYKLNRVYPHNNVSQVSSETLELPYEVNTILHTKNNIAK